MIAKIFKHTREICQWNYRVYASICLCSCVHVHMCVYMYICMCVCLCTHVCVHMHANIHTCVYVFECAWMCMLRLSIHDTLGHSMLLTDSMWQATLNVSHQHIGHGCDGILLQTEHIALLLLLLYALGWSQSSVTAKMFSNQIHKQSEVPKRKPRF